MTACELQNIGGQAYCDSLIVHAEYVHQSIGGCCMVATIWLEATVPLAPHVELPNIYGGLGYNCKTQLIVTDWYWLAELLAMGAHSP
jgi:hypothetical protein